MSKWISRRANLILPRSFLLMKVTKSCTLIIVVGRREWWVVFGRGGVGFKGGGVCLKGVGGFEGRG